MASHGATAIGQVVQPRRLKVPELPVSLGLRPTLLAGREELLAGLDTRLTGSPGRGPRVVALHGLGGAGKTSVAVEYAHRHLAEVGLAWQFPAEDPALLLAEFARLAAQMGAREVVDARDPVASAYAVAGRIPAEWLLVFDNAPGQEAVQRFLPPAGKGRVLITSQSAVWPRGQAMEVPVLATEAAAGFLVNQSADPDEQAAVELASGLAGCRWRWRRPPTSRPLGPLWLGMCRYSGTAGVEPAGPRPGRGPPGGCAGHIGLGVVPAER